MSVFRNNSQIPDATASETRPTRTEADTSGIGKANTAPESLPKVPCSRGGLFNILDPSPAPDIVVENARIRSLVPTPPNDDNEDEYTLSAYGDISLSKIDFVPGPPTQGSPPPKRVRAVRKKTLPPIEPKPKLLAPTNVKKPPPVLSKASFIPNDLDFAALVETLRRAREEKAVDRSGELVSEVGVQSPQARKPIDLDSLGEEVEILIAHGKDRKFRRRGPLPQWDEDNSYSGRGERTRIVMGVVNGTLT